MKKKNGFIFIEIIIIFNLLSFSILPLTSLISKNIKIISSIKEEYQQKILIDNLETIFNKILINNKNNESSYTLIKKGKDLILKENDQIITTIKNININSDISFFLEKKNILNKNRDVLGKVFVINLKVKNKILKKVLII